MLPLGSQVALACNQPRGFSQWCGGKPVENLPWDVESVEQARAHIEQTRKLVAAIDAGDDQLDQAKRIGLGPGRYCELPGRQYVSEYVMPNLYFHVTTAYRSEEHTSELQSLMRISYAVFCLKKKKTNNNT